MELKIKSTLLYVIYVISDVINMASGDFELTIVHNNDVHAHFDEINKYSGECSPKDVAADKCYGGEARRNWFIKDARSRYENTLVLDAGDRFTGTLWFTQYHGEAAATFINMENYDAICLGNHEFDRGVSGLAPYLHNLTVPVVDANIDVSREPKLQGLFNATRIIDVNGVNVGIIGYITRETGFISSPGPTVTFEDEVTVVKREAKALKAAGVEVIIGLSHAGYGMDQKVASQVEEIDVIVGGHSHTFLYTGDQPSGEDIEGPYPTIVTQPSGRTVLVVQAYAWGKYMGFLNVTFDENYDVKSWSGLPVLLSPDIPKDSETQAVLDRMRGPLEARKAEIVGHTNVRMEGDPIQCRLRECNSGNLLTDAMVEYHVDMSTSNDTWALAAIALFSGGGVRASTEPGPISMGQVLTVLPFGNVVDMIQLRGVHLRQAFEHSVANYDVHDRPGAFLQMSGAHVVYDLSKETGDRVVSLELRCLNCTVPEYLPLDDDAIYNILMVDFTIKGGDDYTMIANNVIERVQTGSVDVDVLKQYLQRHNPVFPANEGRIKFINSTNNEPVSSQNCTSGVPYSATTTLAPTNSAAILTFHSVFQTICLYCVSFSIAVYSFKLVAQF